MLTLQRGESQSLERRGVGVIVLCMLAFIQYIVFMKRVGLSALSMLNMTKTIRFISFFVKVVEGADIHRCFAVINTDGLDLMSLEFAIKLGRY